MIGKGEGWGTNVFFAASGEEHPSFLTGGNGGNGEETADGGMKE
jgi:hypothetical protein